ncbi:malate synthase A [Salipaludibacillus agaradhaerens]|uniref:malate synthase A n=1 Tax=Salipaludibacillus agaradhaerens TaxID=76935 RepID=UPI002150DF8C|nr:malate synthase A [Salipaludibacillus agaradhaerens]MCR6108474.1 malate synthase A [Salipaludibacillus agaradhaerens]MCR6120495.1 malate synthase A [Salipaludibacillus agaradhaerens]
MSTVNEKIKILGERNAAYEDILTDEALHFIYLLESRFGERRKELLLDRQRVQVAINEGHTPHFSPEMKSIREGDWTVAPLPPDLLDRRVEITGPVDRKMVINALNSGAKVFMADFEDANSPTWTNCVEGQINLRDAIRGVISYTNESGKHYQLHGDPAVIKVRPRGWHLEEKHLLVDGQRISASLFDFGLYFFHNAKALLEKGSGPYFYLPKIENHREAKLWNDVFVFAQKELGFPQGTIKATVLIETILAAFEMDEILYALKEHSAGLNCGRWDYIFSIIKKFGHWQDVILPDRSTVTMTVPNMRAYSLLAIQTCHKRNVHAIGGMAAHIPAKDNPDINAAAFAKIREDKEREVKDGHDGTWIAHPGMIQTALDVFNEHMPTANQIHRKREDVTINGEDLLDMPNGTITEGGVRTNVSASIRYLASWLSGRGAAPIDHLMEDAATAEISRAQLWQWLHHPKAILEDGRHVTAEMIRTMIEDEIGKITNEVGQEHFERDRFPEAIQLLEHLIFTEHFEEFLTIPAYEKL